jgi:hypothetical protein
VTLAGRALFVALCAWGAFDLTRDVISMATDTIP